MELERCGIGSVNNAFYTHWHPDHTAGRRIFEQLNMDWITDKPANTTTVFLPPKVEEDFKTYGLMDHMKHLERLGVIALRRIEENAKVQIGGIGVSCMQMANPSLYAYTLEENEKRVLLAVDDTYHWTPPPSLRDVDLAVLETGWFEKAPDGTALFPVGNPIRMSEASFEETLKKIRAINAKRTILTHIEEIFQRTYDDLMEIERQYKELNIKFAYDGLIVEV